MRVTIVHHQSFREHFVNTRDDASVLLVARLVLHSVRGFPVTDFAAHLPLELTVIGRLHSTVPGRYWFCEIEPAVTCALAEGVERDHIHPDLLSEDLGSVTVSAVVLTPAASNRVLQSGSVDFPVHVAAVLDPVVKASGQMDPERVGYLGCALVDDAEVAATSQAVVEQQVRALPTRW